MINSTFYPFISLGNNSVTLKADRNIKLICVNINLNTSNIDDFKILSKFDIEKKINEIIK